MGRATRGSAAFRRCALYTNEVTCLRCSTSAAFPEPRPTKLEVPPLAKLPGQTLFELLREGFLFQILADKDELA